MLNENWLDDHLFRYFESLSNHNERLSLAIVGLLDRTKIDWNNSLLYQTILDQIHIKVHEFLTNSKYPRTHVRLYSDLFPTPLFLDDETMSTNVIEQFEYVARQWNFVHHKDKKLQLRQRFAFVPSESIIVDHDACLKRFELEKNSAAKKKQTDHRTVTEFTAATVVDDEDEDEDMGENYQLLVKELDAMTFDQCLDYFQLVGDIQCFGSKSQMILIFKPYYLLNQILAKTIFRPNMEQWLNFDLNHVFRFSGFYLTEEQFKIDCERMFTRGEFTWNMLNVLFYEQNLDPVSLNEQNLIDYCRLMEKLQLGFLNQTNMYCEFDRFSIEFLFDFRLDHEYSIIYFVCPWFLKEESEKLDPKTYFKTLEQNRQFEVLRIERSRRLKQQQLWFSMDMPDENKENDSTKINFTPRKMIAENMSIDIPDLPNVEDVQVFDSQILNSDPIQTIQISTNPLYRLPEGLYERLLICLHPLFHERLDFSNLTLGRTIDKNLIEIERSKNETFIRLRVNQNLMTPIQTVLSHNLFSFFSGVSFRIETKKNLN